jgi:hypothetical protein
MSMINTQFEHCETSSTTEILSLIAKIDEIKGAWSALGTLAPDRLLVLRYFAKKENILSCTRIEGNRLSDLDIEKLLF